jgi:hypothetical protein
MPTTTAAAVPSSRHRNAWESHRPYEGRGKRSGSHLAHGDDSNVTHFASESTAAVGGQDAPHRSMLDRKKP